MDNKKIVIIIVVFLFMTLFSDERCQAGIGNISLNIPSVINPGTKVSVPLDLNMTSGQLNGWMVDIVMDPNYITVQSGADILAGNVPNALMASNHSCVYGSPPCAPPVGMQVTRVTGITSVSSITGSITLNNIVFTGVATSSCGTIVNVIVRDMIDDSVGGGAKFSPLPTNLSLNIQKSGGVCDAVAPAAPTGMSVL